MDKEARIRKYLLDAIDALVDAGLVVTDAKLIKQTLEDVGEFRHLKDIVYGQPIENFDQASQKLLDVSGATILEIVRLALLSRPTAERIGVVMDLSDEEFDQIYQRVHAVLSET